MADPYRNPKTFRATTETTCATCDEYVRVGQRKAWAHRGEAKTYHDWCYKDDAGRVGPPDGTVPGDAGYTEDANQGPGFQKAGRDPVAKSQDLVGQIADAVQERLGKLDIDPETIHGMVAEAVDAAKIDDKIEAAIAARVGPVLVVKRHGAPDVKIEGAHPQFPEALDIVASGQHLYAYGYPGGGKSSIGPMLAEALGRAYGYDPLTKTTPESRLFGHTTVTGGYVTTNFRKLFEHGGIYLLDELDNAGPNLVNALNGALANGRGSFPDGMIDRHPDFVCIATGNTNGSGKNPAFPDRVRMDDATKDRFLFLEWHLDEPSETRWALQQHATAGPWVEWVQRVRTFVRENGLPQMVVSPRASIDGAKLLAKTMLSVRMIADGFIFRGADAAIVDKILKSCPLPKVAR